MEPGEKNKKKKKEKQYLGLQVSKAKIGKVNILLLVQVMQNGDCIQNGLVRQVIF